MTARPSFMLDHMLIRLGKYLRIAGYDAEWDLRARTHDLIRRANAEGRIFVTRNHHAEQFPPVRRLALLRETDPVRQLELLARDYALDLQTGLFSRCIRCNVELGAVKDKQAVAERVHPNVLSRHERFFACPRCGTIFWHGSHVANTCRKLGLPPPAATAP